VHWSVVPTYLLTVPLLVELVLSPKSKGSNTSCAGHGADRRHHGSLRNIELVKSLGLAQQEIARLNATTAKILKLN
jgi:ATP-binding cassette subfamily B protein